MQTFYISNLENRIKIKTSKGPLNFANIGSLKTTHIYSEQEYTETFYLLNWPSHYKQKLMGKSYKHILGKLENLL